MIKWGWTISSALKSPYIQLLLANVPVTAQHDQEDKTAKLAIRLANAVVLPMVLKSAIELNIIDIISATTIGGEYLAPSQIAAMIPLQNPDAAVVVDRICNF